MTNSLPRRSGKTWLLTAAVGLGLLLFGVLALGPVPAAEARDSCVRHNYYHSSNDPSTVCLRYSNYRVDVCDRDTDSHRTYARFKTWKHLFMGWTHSITGYDTNGSSPGCGNYWDPYVYFESQVVLYAVCVQSEGCSGFRYAE